MDAAEFQRMLAGVEVPPAPSHTQPENDLRPDPARIAFDLVLLEARVRDIERHLGISNG